MPASLLASQFAALEAPNDDEAAIRIAVSLSTDAAVTAIKIALADSTAAAKRSP
jgi:gluconate kinase